MRYVGSVNGRQAWDEARTSGQLCRIVRSQGEGSARLVLTDVEMPEMDGYIAYQADQDDPRFEGCR